MAIKNRYSFLAGDLLRTPPSHSPRLLPPPLLFRPALRISVITRGGQELASMDADGARTKCNIFCFLCSQKWRMQPSICFDKGKSLALFFWFSVFKIAKRNGAPFNPLCEGEILVIFLFMVSCFYTTKSGGCNFYSAW